MDVSEIFDVACQHGQKIVNVGASHQQATHYGRAFCYGTLKNNYRWLILRL